MPERIFVAVAWPYANSSLHLGHVAGCYLPADIFARYHRLKGNDVLMVSGSDWHGTPVTVRADEEGKTPREIVEHYQAEFEDSWRQARHLLGPLHLYGDGQPRGHHPRDL